MASSYLYRITKFSTLVDMFESEALYFASPSSWEDPYERVLKHKKSDLFFAQCWSKKSVSDAMWRIYSTDRYGIRIRTSREKLIAALKTNKKENDVGFLVKDVNYLTLKDLNSNLADIATKLRKNYLPSRAAGALLLKRDAFDHEAEVRAILNAPVGHAGGDHLRVRIDAHDFVDNIYFDPRVDPTFEKVCSYYLANHIGYKGVIGKSSLYKDREEILA
ncbi:MAG TPA: DUF2971 domain-containing protein [Devosia sp.]|nr:DUF2971 domain-containing protein [Devosia sp.]